MVIVIIVVVAVVCTWFLITYNLFVRDRNLIKEAWSGIDVQLKRRYDLIPNLVGTVKSYSTHERNLFNQIAETRNKSINIKNIKDKSIVETDLSGMLNNLFAVVENYPDLKANINYLDLQKQLIEIEDQLQYARRYYNGTVRNYNIKVESFPGNIIAAIFKFKQKDYFEITSSIERNALEIKL